MIDRVRSGAPIPLELEPHYTNRIHRDDAAGAIAHLIEQPSPASLYVGVDSEPAARAEVMAWLARELGVSPEYVDPEPASRTGSKRCRNDLLLGAGYRLRYPSYCEGYQALIAAGEETARR